MTLRREPVDIMDFIRDLQRRVRELETARRAGYTSINGGATTVIDDAGNVVVRIGLLSDGTYGIEQRRPDGTYGKLIL